MVVRPRKNYYLNEPAQWVEPTIEQFEAAWMRMMEIHAVTNERNAGWIVW